MLYFKKSKYVNHVGTLCENLEDLNEPEAKGSLIWIIGNHLHFGHLKIISYPHLNLYFLLKGNMQKELKMLTN
jgi:hypothetical protein